MDGDDELLLDRIMSKHSGDDDNLSNFPWEVGNSTDENGENLRKVTCYDLWKSFFELVSTKRGKMFLILAAVFLAVGNTLSVVVIKETRNPFGVILITKMIVSLLCIFKLFYTRTSFIANIRKERLLLTIRGILGGNAISLQLLAYNFISFAVETTIKSTLIFVSGVVGWIILAERMTIIEYIMAIICVIGVIIIAKPFDVFTVSSTGDNGEKMTRDFFLVILGVFISLGDAVFSGTAVVLSRLLNNRGIDTDVIIFCGVVFSMPIDIACCFFTHQAPFLFTLPQWFYLLTCGLFRYVAFFFSTLVCFYEKSTISSLVFACSAVLEFPIQIVFLGTVPAWNTFLGAGLILLGLVVAVLAKSEIISSQQ